MEPKNRRPALSPQARQSLRGALLYFQALRARRGDLTVAQFLALQRLLLDGAEALYRGADRVERGEWARVPRDFFDDLARRVTRVGSADDPVLASVRAAVTELRRQHRERILGQRSPTARELRSAAIRLMSQADAVEVARAVPEGRVTRARSVGRPRNQILDQILDYAIRKGIPDADLARALADVHFEPDGPGSLHVDLADRWAAIIKSARARRRRAGRAGPK